MAKVDTTEFACDYCKVTLPRSEEWPKAPPVENRVQLHIRLPLPDDPAEFIETKATELCTQCRKNLKVCLELYLSSVGRPLSCTISGADENGEYFKREIGND